MAKSKKVVGPGSMPGRVVLESDLVIMPDLILSGEDEAFAQAQFALADAEADARDREDARVNFRWERGPLDVVRRAAALAGVPYQTYIKQVLYQRAIADLAAAAAVDPRAQLDR